MTDCTETFPGATPDDRPAPRMRRVRRLRHRPNAAATVALGLHALQHRGQEACGIAAFDGQGFYTERHMGHVADAFSGPDLVERLPGSLAIGHTRYSTAGASVMRNVQPMFADLEAGGVAIAHNGNLTNFLDPARAPGGRGRIFQSTSDSEVIIHLIAMSRKPRFVDRFIDALAQIEGGYALVALTNKKLIGVRDPLGIRPLVLGDLSGKPVLASETRALDMVGARFVRDVEHGEIVVISSDGDRVHPPVPGRPGAGRASSNTSTSPCRTSVVNGRSVYDVRKRMGRRLAEESLVPRRRGGAGARLRRARRPWASPRRAGLPFEMGIIRNHYVGRTFIQPTQGARELARAHEAQPQPRRPGRQAGDPDRRFDRARHHLGARWCDGARGRRQRGAPALGLAADQVARLLRHRHARPRQAAGRAHRACRRWPSCSSVDSLGFLSVDGLYWAMDAGPRDPARPAVHRPLFHRRLSHPPARPRDRRGPQRAGRAPTVVPGRRLVLPLHWRGSETVSTGKFGAS